ncbi:MAG TPA: pyruvate dehydrogenase (acetyl-transferring) E1 component subunit alpha [Tepidisphaeraceae bacterium]|nr:pyruvate dehydrogenase (acetyl-transferring) E1 component subunit alpha [Tepidisphaeraceae bacterium]
MPSSVVYQGEVRYLQILDESGKIDPDLSEGILPDSEIEKLYEQMILCREFDETGFKLQRSGRMGTFPPNKGAEAASLGAAQALRKGIDYIVPYYRENPAMFLHGLPMHYILLHWMGDERGNAIPRKLAMNPICVAIGAQCLHAVGIAWAFKLRKEDRVVLCFLGDGATSTGDFHEAMNFASLMNVPVIFLCVNNQWAISVPCCKQTASKTFAQKALAYGMPTIQVDGNDLLAVNKSTREAVERARGGEGPSFIEAVTYRLGDHTTADDARRYRPQDQFDMALANDPLLRTRKYLECRGLWDDEKQARAIERARATVHEVAEAAMNIEKPKAEDLFLDTFAELPPELLKQMQTMRTDSIGQDPAQLGLQSRPAHGANVGGRFVSSPGTPGED